MTSRLPWSGWSRLGLRGRFMAMAVLAILSLGVANLLVFEAVASRVVEAELRDRAATLGRRLAMEAATLVLLDDRAGLQRLLEVTLETDRFSDYLMVIDPTGDVRASTFHRGIPGGLAAANPGRGSKERTVLISDRGTEFIDIAAPMLDGDIGVVRVGARMDRVHAGVAQVRRAVVGMVIAMLAVGLLAAYVAAHVIAAPVKRLATRVRTFDPSEESVPTTERAVGGGEVGELVQSFDRMSERLRRFQIDRQIFQERIVRAERLATVGALAAGMAHDVNNPLAGIRNCLKALARDPADVEQTRSYAQMMIEATRSIERSVRELMRVAASTRPRSEQVDVATLLERTSMLVRHRFHVGQADLEVRLPERLPVVQSDEGLLQQILVNLLINACDASPAGGTVTLQARARGEDLVVQVTDRGSGISPEVADRLFEPFVTTKAEHGGTGLGLAMVRTLVAELDGEVSFETAEGRGTCFTVTLPLGAPSP